MEEKPKRSLKQYLWVTFTGFAMGTANVIPGVSGGTMAFILGIYEELIDSIRQFASTDTLKLLLKFKIKELYQKLPWPFLLALGIGVGCAIVSLAKVLSFSLKQYPEVTFAFFFGLIIASILTVLKRVKKWSASRYVAILLGTVAAYLIVTLVPVETPHTPLVLFICGAIIICAMILPGISGSFLLLILGQYQYVLDAVNNRQIMVLIWVALGCGVGLASFVHLLNWLFKKYHDLTVATLIGFMVGSLWKIWPWQKESIVRVGNKVLELPAGNAAYQAALKAGTEKIKILYRNNILPANLDGSFWLAIVLAVFGFAIVMVMERMASGKPLKDSEQAIQ